MTQLYSLFELAREPLPVAESLTSQSINLPSSSGLG